MHKNQRGFGVLEIIISIVVVGIVIALGLYTWTRISTKSNDQGVERQDIKSRPGLTNEVSDLPSNMQAFATEAKNKFIDKIGQDIYTNNYRIDINSSIECADTSVNQGKCVAFIYLPPSEYGLEDTFIFARVKDGSLVFTGKTENCVETPDACLFNISPDQAREKMTNAGHNITTKVYLEADEQRGSDSFYTEWWWKAGIPSKEHPDPECRYNSSVKVRVSDGVTITEQSESCT